MTKKFVLDTNVLLHDPTAIESFKGKEVIIPIYAIEEIDRFKRELSERGRNARLFSRYLDHLRKEGASLRAYEQRAAACFAWPFWISTTMSTLNSGAPRAPMT